MNEGKNLIKTFLKMVQIDSESGQEDKFSKFCIQSLKKLGFLVESDSYGNIIAHNNNQEPPLLLCAHLDTVSPGKNIKPIIKNNIISSDGKTILGADNKLAIAIYLEVIKSLKEEGKKIRSLEIVFSREEESGMVGARKLDFSKIRAREGISIDTEGPISHYVSSSPYAKIFQIEVTGRAAHASHPEKGIDALKIFSEAYTILKTGRINKITTLNFGVIKGGEGGNIVVEKVVSSGNIRSHLKTELVSLEQEMKNVFNKIAKRHDGKVNINFTKVMEGYTFSQNHPIIQKISRAASCKLKSLITNSGSDANIFHEHKIKIVELYHGIKNTHTTQEQVSIKTMMFLFDLIKKILMSYQC